MKFPLDFFKDEYREDFLVESMVKRAWAAQLEVLGHIVNICEKHNIQYWAMWGTLLGSVRHNGYIPWDDDLDIAMKRPDYDKFLQVAANELPDGYVVMSPYTEPEWKEQIARVNNSHSIKFTDEFLDEYHGFPYSAGVDIFPYDFVPDDNGIRREQASLISLVADTRRLVLERDERIHTGGGYQEELDVDISVNLESIENIFGFEFNRNVFLDNQLLCLYDQIAASYGDNSCKFMTCLAERSRRQKHGDEFLIPTYLLDEIVDHIFEKNTIRVPKYYEIILSKCYGKNFMIPIKAAAGHDYPYFKGQVEVLKEIGRYEEVMVAVEKADERAKESNLSSLISDLKTDEDCKSICNGWNKNGKKAIMYCVSTVDILDTEESALDKFQRTLSFFEEKQDEVQTVLLLAPFVEDILGRKDEGLVTKYKNIVDKYINDGWGYHTEADNVKMAAEYCDAYYGSPNEYIRFFTLDKKPVMIQNLEI